MIAEDHLAIADRLCDRAGDDELLLAGAAAVRLLCGEVEALRVDIERYIQRDTDRLAEVEALRAALQLAKAALEDIGDADREPGDDVAWCERRAAQPLPIVRTALAAKYTRKDGA